MNAESSSQPAADSHSRSVRCLSSAARFSLWAQTAAVQTRDEDELIGMETNQAFCIDAHVPSDLLHNISEATEEFCAALHYIIQGF